MLFTIINGRFAAYRLKYHLHLVPSHPVETYGMISQFNFVAVSSASLLTVQHTLQIQYYVYCYNNVSRNGTTNSRSTSIYCCSITNEYQRSFRSSQISAEHVDVE